MGKNHHSRRKEIQKPVKTFGDLDEAILTQELHEREIEIEENEEEIETEEDSSSEEIADIEEETISDGIDEDSFVGHNVDEEELDKRIESGEIVPVKAGE